MALRLSLALHPGGSSTSCQPNAWKFRLTLLPIFTLPAAAAWLLGPSFHFMSNLAPASLAIAWRGRSMVEVRVTLTIAAYRVNWLSVIFGLSLQYAKSGSRNGHSTAHRKKFF